MKKPRLFKKRTSKPIPAGAEIVTHRNRRCARWASRGRTYTVPLNRKRTRIVYESENWWIGFEDAAGKWQEVPGYADKTASQALLVELVRKSERGQVGIADPLETHRKRPLAEHIADFEKHLASKDDTPEHVALTVQRIKSVVDGIGASVIGEISASRVAEHLADLRRNGLPVRQGSKRRRKPLSTSSSNHYFRAMRAFCRWLVQDRRVEGSPIAGLSPLKADKDLRRRRRAMTEQELRDLVQAARASDATFRDLSGEDRAMLYLLASNTGLRAAELASLTAASLDLASDPATVRVLGGYTKNGEEAELPLRADLASMLSEWARGRPSDRPLWPGTWANKASAKMIRMDLEAAGVAYQDASGRYADFHSLRHTFISNLARAGVHPKTAIELARHKKLELTLGVYTHMLRGDSARALEPLPGISEAEPAEAGKTALAGTGTGDGRAPVRAQYARKAYPRGRTEEGRGKPWQDGQAGDGGADRGHKSLPRTGISKARQSLTGLVSKRGRRDSNPQPPDRQSGTLAN
jgi:site-specific recombinase XerC